MGDVGTIKVILPLRRKEPKGQVNDFPFGACFFLCWHLLACNQESPSFGGVHWPSKQRQEHTCSHVRL